ncbi:TPA: accessory Sec system protein Asp1 [Streptococcus suis]
MMMFYFIPSWYPEKRTWYDNTELWYRRNMSSYFDDTINQLRMFVNVGEPSQLIVLNYMPNLRYYTHRYGLFEVPYWSVFDHIQGIAGDDFQPLDYLDMEWPDGIEFINSPFLVIARLKGQLFAQLEFGEEGNLVWIDFFDQDVQSKKMVFDDRGFLSSILYYQDGQPYYQDYLGKDGVYRIREYLLPDNQQVLINPTRQYQFFKNKYDSIEELISEQLERFLSAQPKSTIVLAADGRHHETVAKAISRHTLVLSYFGNRFEVDSTSQLQVDRLLSPHLIVTDSLKTQQKLENMTSHPVHQVSLYDTRLALGKSQRLKELYIYFLLDGVHETHWKVALQEIFVAMKSNEYIHLMLVTYQSEKDYLDRLKEEIELELEQMPEEYLKLKENTKHQLFEVGDEEEEVERVAFTPLHSEVDIMVALESVRLIIDLADEPNLYTQIAGISAGIPQVNARQTEYVEHLKNGYILTDGGDLGAALNYYLDGLSHWNESLIYSVRKISDYTSGVLVEKIKEKVE